MGLGLIVALLLAQEPAPPARAIGFPDRAPDLDARPGFRNPPPGYGEVAFYWWVGDPLTKERLGWQLDRLAGKGVMGLQINYAHTDSGGMSYGLSMPSDPPLFSKAWWELFDWFIAEAKKRGMAVSLSDYTLGIGQGFSLDGVLKAHPDLNGSILKCQTRDADGGGELKWELPEKVLSVVAYRREGAPGPGQDLRANLAGRTLSWKAPEGRWRVAAVHAEPAAHTLDPLNPKSGPEYVRAFFQPFEDRCPGEGGKGLNFFFSDELEFRLRGNLWTGRFAEEFLRRKGYDLLPELPALFMDAGPRTPKIRLDYSDVKVALTEEGFFKPVFDWHQKRGMIYGCDHGGRGRDVTEFGDYFRTQRWNQGPGCDQPGLGRDVIKNKVASSIAHLYLRPRVWIEGYYGSGWGTTSSGLADATFANFAMGHNLLTLHGLYYTTHGGWWEWAPPCNHWRMPYWDYLGGFMACVQRLSYLLSQGHHRCDVAVLYPVAPMEAGMDGAGAVAAAFGLGPVLYGRGIDFDFMDFESLERARVSDRRIEVSGESYRVLVLPSMRAVRHSTMRKALEFHRAGGIVAALGALPEASDRAGREDAELGAMVREVFGDASRVAKKAEEVAALVERSFPRDFAVVSGKAPKPCVMHRRVGPREVYAVYGVPRGAECLFRARGKAELWDPWTGGSRPLWEAVPDGEGTRVRMPLGADEIQLIVFEPGVPNAVVESSDLDEILRVEGAVVEGIVSSGGPKTATLRLGEKSVTVKAEAPAPPEPLPLDGDWEFELKPTMDNRFGDFHWPPTPGFIGAEARQFRYSEEDAPGADDSKWKKVTRAFGPRFLLRGPLPAGAPDAALEAQWAARAAPPEDWVPYEFSWRWGVEGDPGHQGYHGLKEKMYDDFIRLGRLADRHRVYAREPESAGTRYYLWTTVVAADDGPKNMLTGGQRPSAAWVNGARVKETGGPVTLKPGANPVLLRYDKPGTGYVVFSRGGAGGEVEESVFSGAARYVWIPGERATATRHFRKAFTLDDLPESADLRITCDNGYAVFVNGREAGKGNRWEAVQRYDVRSSLRKGRNAVAVRAVNEGDSAGLIAELTLKGAKGLQRIATDASWRCAREAGEGWLNPDFDDASWGPAEAISSFADSLWYKHPNGPPALEAAPADVPEGKAGALAMRWHEDPDVLPFDVRPRDAKPAGGYRFAAAPGLKSMSFAAHGKVRAWADGKERRVETGRRRKDGAVEVRVDLGETVAGCARVELRIEQDRGCYGGAAIPEPVAQECGPGILGAGDWARIDGLRCYSGGAWYRKTVALTPEQVRGRVALDLGRVASSAEVRVNGKVAGIRVAPPWTVDVTDLVRPGENRVEVLVCNTLANHYLTVPTRYRGDTTSGLLGPVVLRFPVRVTLR